MTIYCIVCKKEPSPRDSSRSFHKFPDNEQLKERWMKAVGVSSVTKHTKICSDHFDTNDFHDTDGYTRVRRLLSTAVPFNKNKVLSNITNVTSTCVITQDQEQLVQHVSNISSEGQKKSKMSDLSMHPDTVINDSTSDLRNSHMTQNLQEQDITSIQNHSKESKSNENHRRNQPPIDVSDIPPSKTFRFVDGCQPTHLSREDFTSDDAWTRFLKYTVFKNRQIDVFRKRNQRRDYKIGNINKLITKLREENATNAADYLQGLPEHVQQLIPRMKNNKSTSPFPAHLKTFARSLHFHSPVAYKMVWKSFIKCLPCVETLNRWNCSRNYKPGMSEEIINHVSEMVKNECKKGKKLVFNLTFDEMGIKEWAYYCQ